MCFSLGDNIRPELLLPPKDLSPRRQCPRLSPSRCSRGVKSEPTLDALCALRGRGRWEVTVSLGLRLRTGHRRATWVKLGPGTHCTQRQACHASWAPDAVCSVPGKETLTRRAQAVCTGCSHFSGTYLNKIAASLLGVQVATIKNGSSSGQSPSPRNSTDPEGPCGRCCLQPANWSLGLISRPCCISSFSVGQLYSSLRSTPQGSLGHSPAPRHCLRGLPSRAQCCILLRGSSGTEETGASRAVLPEAGSPHSACRAPVSRTRLGSGRRGAG